MERYAGATSQLKQIEAQEALKIFVMETKQIFFPGKKSLHLRHGTIGFRTGTPRVVKKQSITWETALRLFKHKEWPVSVKEWVDKEQIIAQRGDRELMEALSDIGIAVRQEERFFIAVDHEKL